MCVCVSSYTAGFLPAGRMVASPQSVPSATTLHDGGVPIAAFNVSVARSNKKTNISGFFGDEEKEKKKC